MMNNLADAYKPVGQSLPHCIQVRMVELNLRPSWGQLALVSGVNLMTLQHSLKNRKEPGIRKVRKLAQGLQLSTDQLCDMLGW